MDHKTFSAYTIKADIQQGIVESIVAVMGNEDQGGDVIHPGAFAKTIAERRGKIRVLDQHRTDSIMRAIGKPIEMREISRDQLPPDLLERYPTATGGLYAKTQYLMDTPEGLGAFNRIAAGAVDEYSIGYDPLDIDFSKIRGADGKEKTVRNLRTIKLYEFSPVLFGMNDATQTLSAKGADGAEDATETDDAAPAARKVYKDSKPWAVFHEGDKWNVYKVDADGNQTGDALGSHDTEAEARAQVRALYSSENGKSLKSLDLTSYVREVTDEFMEQFNSGMMYQCFYIWRVFDDHLIVCDMMSDDYYRVDYAYTDGEFVFAPQSEWIEGDLAFVPEAMEGGEMKRRGDKAAPSPEQVKAGRVLAARNAERIMSAARSLMAALADAGISMDGADDNTDEAPADEKRAALTSDDTRAGPSQTPTLEDLRQSLEIELDMLKLLEV